MTASLCRSPYWTTVVSAEGNPHGIAVGPSRVFCCPPLFLASVCLCRPPVTLAAAILTGSPFSLTTLQNFYRNHLGFAVAPYRSNVATYDNDPPTTTIVVTTASLRRWPLLSRTAILRVLALFITMAILRRSRRLSNWHRYCSLRRIPSSPTGLCRSSVHKPPIFSEPSLVGASLRHPSASPLSRAMAQNV
jgi:hypothetical protein